MGRRKIEIQPITHERNRSVTFLKVSLYFYTHSLGIVLTFAFARARRHPHQHLQRKNGLFKKAYELGVLCSVDVAVIIFEERPGHHVKLYQYCSTDVHNIVQRHVRFDGEKDTRTPADFSNNKAEEAVDDDDDGDEDEGARPKPNGRSKSKSEVVNNMQKRPGVQADMSLNLEMDYPVHNARGSPHSGGSHGSPTGHAISGERHNAGANAVRSIPINNKRPRLAPIEQSPDHLQSAHSAPAGLTPSSTGSSYPYRLDVDISYSGSGHLGGPVSSSLPHPQANTHPSLAGLYPQHGSNTPFDFPRHQVPPTLRSVTFPQHSPTPYTQVGHHQQQPQSLFSSHGRQSAPGGPVSASNMFVELMNPAEHTGHHSQSQNFPSFDWPVHAQQQSRHDGGTSRVMSSLFLSDLLCFFCLHGRTRSFLSVHTRLTCCKPYFSYRSVLSAGQRHDLCEQLAGLPVWFVAAGKPATTVIPEHAHHTPLVAPATAASAATTPTATTSQPPRVQQRIKYTVLRYSTTGVTKRREWRISDDAAEEVEGG
ncbi:hypothetical protein EUX98_g3682 [Antrodiella citrinella]|uniref:MADS-box domain-containing protein n=1 Tax=Antrodiella citrinella TaxID=2447956 RepID=A0A4S4MVZ5_9APHY|nr:hypothetical protein EUX98_g3682 [Antrodiella citrinella]